MIWFELAKLKMDKTQKFSAKSSYVDVEIMPQRKKNSKGDWCIIHTLCRPRENSNFRGVS